MNSEHKLYDYQVTPPADAWMRIAAELEELQELKPLGQTLEQMQIAPPAAAWDHIKKSLEEKDGFEQLSEKLMDFEVAPPASSWEKIESVLDNTVPVPGRATVKKVNFSWSRYAVAAAVIALAGLGIFYMMGQSKQQNNGIALNTPAKQSAQKAADIKEQEAEKSAATSAKNPLLASAQIGPTQIKTAAGNTYKTTVEKNKSLQGRYIMLMTEDGDVVRMSKKLGNVADCVAGESDSESCNHQIEEWQEELARASVATTPDNFLGLLALANDDPSGL